MPPKGSKKRAGSVSASSFDDLTATVHAGNKKAADALVETTHIAEKGAAIAHKVINNKSGRPQDILTTYDMAYAASSTYMTPKGKHFDASPPTWVIYWFLISATVMLWDAGYVLTREKYSDQLWHKFIWGAYHSIYSRVDKFYAVDVNSMGAGYLAWARSQTQINVLEIFGQYAAAAMSASPIGSVLGLTVSVSTFIKTVLYMLMIWNSPNPAAVLPSAALATPQDKWDFFVTFLCTNGWWILIPGLVIHTLTQRLIAGTLHS